MDINDPRVQQILMTIFLMIPALLLVLGALLINIFIIPPLQSWSAFPNGIVIPNNASIHMSG